jgi:hypothetical protein
MSTFARDARIQAFHEIGVKIDDALETARLETARREGAHAAYANAARNVLALVKSAAESGSPDVATVWVKKCAAACESLATQAAALAHASKGAEKQAETLVAAVKQAYDLEVVMKKRETEPVPPPPPDAPVLPVKPRTIKEERLVEAETLRKAAEEAPAPKKVAKRPVKKAPSKKR